MTYNVWRMTYDVYTSREISVPRIELCTAFCLWELEETRGRQRTRRLNLDGINIILARGYLACGGLLPALGYLVDANVQDFLAHTYCR